MIDDILFINDYTKKVLTKDSYYYYENKSFTAIPLLLTSTAVYDALIEKHPLKNMGFFSWYSNNSITNYSQIKNPETINNLNIAKNLEIVVRPIFRNSYRLLMYEGKSNYISIFHIFDNDEFYYIFPCPSSNLSFNFSSISMNETCLKNKGKTISTTCSLVYLEAKSNAEVNKELLTVTSPQPLNISFNVLNNTASLAFEVCHSILNSSSQIQLITCISANISDLSAYLIENSAIQLGELTFLIYEPNGGIGSVLLRAGNNFQVSTFFGTNDRSSLMKWEFGVFN